MSGESRRWHGQRSSFPWEQEALDLIKEAMPDAEPYRAWQTFTFTGTGGHVREVDLFIATPGGLFLVEIKSHPGEAGNNGATWLFRDGRRLRTIENPLHLTNQKAKELKSQLERAAQQLKVRERIPFVQAAVFLSAPNLVCEFDAFQRPCVYGRDGLERQTHLDGIWTGLLGRPSASERNRVTPAFSRQLPKLLEKIGIARLHKLGRVGPYELEPRSFGDGPTWEDYLATNPSLPDDAPRRVRVYLTERSATEDERTSVQRAAYREYLALQGISHEGIVRAETYSDELQNGPALVFRHGRDWQRLDHFMAAAKDLPVDTRLEMIRQLAEATDHAHRRHLYHRALAPRSVYVEMDGRYPRLRIADWQVAARPNGTGVSPSPTTYLRDPAALLRNVEQSAGAYLAPEFPNPEAPAALMDVFGLGALGYLILTGKAPAASRTQLQQRLGTEHALVPSAVADSVSPAMDALVRDATQVHQADRTESVREFLKNLDAIEEELTAPDTAAEEEKDPLTATPGDQINGWTVRRTLGKGSTSKAFLVAKGDGTRVFKVALSDSAARRLHAEAEQLGPLNDSHVARLLDPPFEFGPDGKRRTLIGVEFIDGPTLADELRRHGLPTIHELERLGEDLFQAITFLDRRQIWHRDIKPDNLALRNLERKGRELVLFDFSLAGTPDTELGVGTKAYLDPFLGTANRQHYDQAAELYAVAVTLHEMASGELPSWGDDLADPGFLDETEEVQLAADLFDPVARDGLTDFFKVALHRDATQRFRSLHEMAVAWTDIFRDLETVPPLTTSSTEPGGDDENKDVKALRAEAVAAATPTTPIGAAGLSAYALSVALRLGVNTAGDLARVPAGRITRLRGIGSVPRYELVRLSRDWRNRFNLTESGLPRPDAGWLASDHPERTGPSPQGPAPAESAADLQRLSVDEVARRLVPDEPELRQVTGLQPGANGRTVAPWAGQRETAQVTGIPEADVAAHLERLRNRWRKSVRGLTQVRDDLVEILAEHGRILGWRQLAEGLLARRGSDQSDSDERLARAAVCVRAAVETEESRESFRMVSRRFPGGDGGALGTRVIVALRRRDEEEDEALVPRLDDLFAYAELLGGEADRLSARDPLPGVTEIRRVLREVDIATRLSDTDLVRLAAAASRKTAATPRLELYPRDLSALRALKIAQVGSVAEGVFARDLVQRVLARFPDLDETGRPAEDTVEDLLKVLGYDVTTGSQGKLHIRSSSQLSGSRARAPVRRLPASELREAGEHAAERLAQSRQRGGFVALKAPLRDAAAIGDYLAAMDGVTGVNVTREFVRLLRDAAARRPRLRWETVLAADTADAPAGARRGFGELLRQVWGGLEEHIRGAGDGRVVLLHDATPLARYTGGDELLARLTVAARDAAENPFGLWLLCPMQDPQGPPLLDRTTVSVIPGDAEQLQVPEGFGSGRESRAS